jgi:hypothetical protein
MVGIGILCWYAVCPESPFFREGVLAFFTLRLMPVHERDGSKKIRASWGLCLLLPLVIVHRGKPVPHSIVVSCLVQGWQVLVVLGFIDNRNYNPGGVLLIPISSTGGLPC